MSNSLWLHGPQHIRPPWPSPSPRVCPSSCSLHQWCCPAISSSDALFPFSIFPIIRDFSNDNIFRSVQFSRSVMSNCLWPCGLQPARPPCPSPTPGAYSNSCPSHRWCHPTISSSAVPFSSCPQSLLASESFPMSQLFTWGCQSIGVSPLASVLSMNIQDWSPLGWTGWISLQSKGFSRVFSNTTVQKHRFFSAQLSL